METRRERRGRDRLRWSQDVFELELRCALSVARHLATEERYDAARRMLRTVLSRLPAEVDAPERGEAEHLLRELHG